MKHNHGHTTINRPLKAWELPTPGIYDPRRADELYAVKYAPLVREATEWRAKFNIRPRRKDGLIVKVAAIDMQGTFGCTWGELSLAPGCTPEINRAAEFAYRNLRVISEWMKTFDVHEMIRAIFSPLMWLDEKGQHPGLDAPQMITNEDVRKGKFRINPEQAYLQFGDMKFVAWLEEFALYYTEQLEKQHNEFHFVWTIHSQLGSVGLAEVPQLHQATQFMRVARWQPENDRIKGLERLSERYAPDRSMILEAHDKTAIGEVNPETIEDMLDSDVLIIFGWAGSHCQRHYTRNIVKHYLPKRPEIAKKIYVCKDICAPVPFPICVKMFEDALKEYEAAGMHVVDSTTPMDEWPDMPQELFTGLV